jgi:hypothetical protein
MSEAVETCAISPDQKLNEMFNRASNAGNEIYVSAACVNLPDVRAAISFGLTNGYIQAKEISDGAGCGYESSGAQTYVKTPAGIQHYTNG